MPGILRHGTALLKIGLVMAIVAGITSNPVWRAELQAQDYEGYTKYIANVRCEVGNEWDGDFKILWSETVGAVGDSSECESRVQSAFDRCSQELSSSVAVRFLTEGCMQL